MKAGVSRTLLSLEEIRRYPLTTAHRLERCETTELSEPVYERSILFDSILFPLLHVSLTRVGYIRFIRILVSDYDKAVDLFSCICTFLA